jgi:tetratricopeptide (TPR) repeat protein
VYALLVMSSDGPRAAGLSPDYTVSWKDLLQRLIEFIVFEEVLVETWDEREIAVIKGKGCILGQVSLVESDGARYDRQYVDIAFNNTSKSLEYEELYGTRWSLRASAKHIRQYDFVYLLQGAAKPAIIRKCKDHFAIVIIAVTILQSEPTESGYIERQEPLASTGSFSYDFLLVWKWEDFPEDLQYRAAAGYETLPEINSLVPEYLKTTSDKAARSCEVALVLRESEDLQEEAKRLQEAIKGCEELFGKENPRALGGMDNLALAYEKLALVYTSQEQWTNAEMEWTNAEDQFLRVIEIRKRVQGIDHQDTLNSIAGLALAYIDQRNSSPMWRGLVKSLTGRIRDNLQIREEEMAEVTRYFRKGLITLLLELKRDNIPVTEKVVKAAAENQEYSKEMMAALLDQRSNEVKITEEVVKAAAGNWWTGEDIMTLLLDQRGTEFKITEEVVKAAAGNWHTGEAIMTLLLDQRGTEFKITEEVVKAAARNQLGKYIMALLLDRRGTEVKITGEIIKEVAGNSRQGKVIMALLRKHKGDEVKIAEQELNVKSGLFLYPW